MAYIKAIIPGYPHTVELRNCDIDRSPKNAIAYNADIYIDGRPVGDARNPGWCGRAVYVPNSDADKSTLQEAEDAIGKIQFLNFDPKSRWSLPLLFNVMIEEAVVRKKETLTVKTIKKTL